LVVPKTSRTSVRVRVRVRVRGTVRVRVRVRVRVTATATVRVRVSELSRPCQRQYQGPRAHLGGERVEQRGLESAVHEDEVGRDAHLPDGQG
jgi:hypothetical protein